MEASTNPFANPDERIRKVGPTTKSQEETTNGWSFQGRNRHTPKLASPRLVTQLLTPHTPNQEATPGGKRGQLHSEVPPSFFTALGISIPHDREPLRVRVWPVLVREKNFRKEILVHSKSQAQPILPLSIRLMGSVEAKWTQDSARADLIQRLEVELEEKVLRYKLTLKVLPQLEWSW